MSKVYLSSINELLVQSYPFILVDSFQKLERGKSLTALKNITGTEWCFCKNQLFEVGKFPETLLLESASQAAVLLYRLSGYVILESEKLVLSKIKAVFEKDVYIGDQVLMEVLVSKMLERMGLIDVNMSVKERKIATVQIMYSKISNE